MGIQDYSRRMHAFLTLIVTLTLAFAVVNQNSIKGCGGCGPSPRNGGWGSWEPADWNFVPCKDGSKTKRRHCNNPSPAHGGKHCSGKSTYSIDCNECNVNNGGCEHRCINLYRKHTCRCYPGYKISPRGWKTCERISCATSNWPAPSNGLISNICRSKSRVASGTTCIVTCKRGYRLNGHSSSQCGNDGKWSPNTSPSCQVRSCPRLTPPDKGEITPSICKSNPLHGTTCNYKCKSDFTRYGPSSTKCDDGHWTQGGFQCQDTQPPSFGETCPLLQTVFANEGKTTATVTWAPVKATDNQEVTVTVSPNVKSPHEFSEGRHTVIYTAKDRSQLTSYCLFQVNVQVLRCPLLPLPLNGIIKSAVCGNVYGSKCHMACNKGYKLKGSMVRKCDKISGTNRVQWTGNTTYCEVVDCPSVDTPINAIKTGHGCNRPTTSYGTTCFFNCKLGYAKEVGSSQRTCQEEQRWSGTPLQCQAVSCPAITMKSEGLLINPPICTNSTAILSYETECRFSCKRGYQLQGPGLKTCAQNKNWAPLGNPFCKDVSEPTFSNCPSNIIATTDRGTTSASVTWTPPSAADNSGLIPNITHSGKRPGGRFSAGEHNIRYLATDKSGNVAECRFKVFVSVVRCVPRLYAPAGGTKQCTQDNMYGSECSFTCHLGHTMTGSDKRDCEMNLASSTGFWTGNETNCELVRCPLLLPPPHSIQSGCGTGAIDNVFGDKCLLYCKIGYQRISGSTERVCQANGTWSGTAISCQVVRCRPLQAPKDGFVSPSSCKASPEYGTTCHFSCPKGYRLKGEPVASCLSDGQWSKSTNAFCKDMESPSFGLTCPSNINRYADRAKNYTTVGWPPVIATDNSGVTPNVSSTGVRSIYYKGKHLVMYNASDEAMNYKICKFYVSVEVLRCQTLYSPLNGFFVGNCDNTYGSSCLMSCNDGYDLLGSENTTCQIQSSYKTVDWDNPIPACKIRRCSPLKPPVFGSIYPQMCTMSPVSGTVCYFECSHGFSGKGGANMTHCGNDGTWNINDHSILKCVDVTQPTFLSCPSDIRASLSANSSASVNWKIPVALDNSNQAPKITVSPPGVTPPYTFHNNTLIVYTAEDASGNKKECSFKILLEDNLSPVVVYCPRDQNISVTNMRTLVTWKSPQFEDNSNSPLVIKCSHKSGTEFYWGTWNVHCTAFDNNPNNDPAVCQFSLRLKPKDCKDLPAPKNGAKACDDWALGRICSPFCNDEWDFTQQLPPFAMWLCGASGRWFPPMRWPDCSKVYQPGQARMAMDLHYYNGDCNSPASQAQIKENFIKILNGSIFEINKFCRDAVYRDKCKAENVKVTCALVEFVINRKKRSSDDVEFHGTQRHRLIPQTTITLDIVVKIEEVEVNATKDDKILAGLAGVEIAKKINKEIKTAVDNGSLSLTINDTVFVPDTKSLNVSEPRRTCVSGQAYRDGFCVSCSSGTYLNKTLGTCQDCPIGTYQEQDSQETCLPCPPRTSTVEPRTDNRSSCIAFCKAGSYSPTGLKPCFPCEKGFYQEIEGQRTCLRCGINTTTAEEGSSSSLQCGVPCPSGSFSATGLAPCSLCKRRFFQPQMESRECVPCPGTTVTAHLGSKSSQDCKEIDKCNSNPCKGKSTCKDLIGDFLCTCQPGYTGKQCDIDINDCSDQPCLNNGTCHDLVNTHLCTCAQGYQGFNCEDDVDECILSPCSNNASCSNIPGGYECQCKPGFTGKLCDTEIDECLLSPCQNGGTCKDGINNYECLCLTGYQGNDCDENIDDCASDPCQNEAKCVDGIGTYRCVCSSGFNGTNCEHDIDECTNADCKNNAVCLDQVNGFYCVCQEGFTGKACEIYIDGCISNPCKNQARCEDSINSYHCYCKNGFDGLHCENNIDDCASNPCSNNATCHDGVNIFTCACPPGLTGKTCSLDIDYCSSMPCFNNASCFEGRTSFSCQCTDGFNGEQCQHNIDDCQNATCSNGGTCIDGTAEYTCECPAGFTGLNCEINIDECAENPCLNEGICTDLENDYHCTCKRGYAEQNCSVDINDCLSFPCENNGTCIDHVDSYTCACLDGFSGLRCEVNVDDCFVNACTNGAKCMDGINSYTCDCSPGFWGRYCETEMDECESFPCLYGGTCHDQVNAFYCACQTGFTGQRCEINSDDCQPNPCTNNGTCVDLVANYSCSCPIGFTGDHCEKRIDYCRDANCTGNGTCVNLLTGFRCTCSSGYFGDYCEFEIDECLVQPCFNNATCHDAVNSFNCSCTAGFTGRYCELNIDDCVSNSCQNNATCIDHTLGYSCLCAGGYNGTLCQTEINECESAPCQNNGTCVNRIPGYRCRCLNQFTGENCENLTDLCLSSPCQNGGTCQADNSTGNITCLCKTGFTGITCDVNINDCASEPCMPNSYCLDLVNGYECKCHPTHTGDHCDVVLGSNFDLIFKRLTTDDMVILSDREGIPNIRSFTIALFVRADSGYSSGTLFSYSVPGEPKDIIILSFTKSHIELAIKDKIASAEFTLADGLWHFVGVIWDGKTGSISVYIDGSEIEKARNVLKGSTITGGGWIVLGQRYLAEEKKSVLSTAFVGTLHQVNVWEVPATPEQMWSAAHNCTWPFSGSLRGWTSFIFGLKGKVIKRFKTQCKALDKCTANCSHFRGCDHESGRESYYCSCQPGFSGPNCNINIDDCNSNHCVNGKCVDGLNRYDCICDKGYWGTNCEKKIINDGECTELPNPLNGKKSCNNFSGRKLCTMACNEGYSYDTETITLYRCGPDTKWKWNGMENVDVPSCSSKAAPNEIEQRFQMAFRSGFHCKRNQSPDIFRSAIEEEVNETISTIPGCLNSNACKLKEVTVPECGWFPNQKRRRAVTDSKKKVLFSMLVKAADSASMADDVEEKSEAILFQMQYTVSTGQFMITFDGVNSTADRSSFKYLSFTIKCNTGFVTSIDRKGCVACPVGTSYWHESSTCTICPPGTYQDEEAQLSCKICGKGKTTYFFGATSSDDCLVEKGNL